MDDLPEWVHRQLVALGMPDRTATLLDQLVIIAVVALLAVLANYVAKRIILRAVKAFIARTPTDWDDYFLHHHVFDRLSHLAPAMVIHASSAVMFPTHVEMQSGVKHAAIAYMFVMMAIVADGFLNAIAEIYDTFEVSRTRPIKSYVQVVKIIVYLVAGILIISALTDRSPWGLLSGLGALTAVLMLVFKDTILGFVASIQVTAYDIVRPGDWIEIPKHGIDGDVIEVTLNTVKVQNFDKTISTVPTYSLVSEALRNWRGMSDSGGRRIKRAIYIDQNSVQFVTPEQLERFGKMELLKAYLADKQAELTKHNEELGADPEVSVNGRRLTNLGTFRAYVLAYLKSHPKIHQGMTLLVRQLAPGPEGIGIELYCFSNDQNWGNYEAIQADIFDHLLAAVQEFDLRVFQSPGGEDVRSALLAAGPR